MPDIIVQPLDEHTLLSQSASGTSAISPSVTMSWIGQSSTATGEEDQPPGCVDATSFSDVFSCVAFRYTQARAPTRMLEYTFSSYGASTLLIIPPADAPDTRPLYHISSFTNVLNPSSGTTVLHRGGSVSQPLVGEFEQVHLRVPRPRTSEYSAGGGYLVRLIRSRSTSCKSR
jgi:hypothetical protein